MPEPEIMSTPPKKKKITLTGIVLYAVALFMIFRVPWNDINSFHFLLIFLFLLCLMLRFSNMRRAKMREFAMKRKLAEEARAERAAQEALLAKEAEEAANAAESADTSAEIEAVSTPTEALEAPAEVTKTEGTV